MADDAHRMIEARDGSALKRPGLRETESLARAAGVESRGRRGSARPAGATASRHLNTSIVDRRR